MILVDTSVWIQVFKKEKPLDLEAHVHIDEVVTCLPIVQEVLQGFREEAPFRLARNAMRALPTVESPMSRPVYEEAAELYRLARRQGVTVRSSIDCLIAACAIRNDLTVLHVDRDYEQLRTVSALREKRI